MAIALISIFATGSVTLLVLFLTFRLTRANEHHKWLREKRFEVYAELLAAIEEARHRSKHDPDELSSAELRYETALNAAFVLAGATMTAALDRWMLATAPGEVIPWYQRDFSDISERHDHLKNAMDRELGVTPPSQQWVENQSSGYQVTEGQSPGHEVTEDSEGSGAFLVAILLITLVVFFAVVIGIYA